MRRILTIAVKDLRLLFRDKLAAFFVLGFPLLMGVFFGVMMGGPGSSSSANKMRVAVVDNDQSPISQRFISALQQQDSIECELDELEPARDSVRRGRRVGMLVIPAGFSRVAGILWEDAPEIQLGMDPSRSAESAMLHGFVMEAMGQLIAYRFQHPDDVQPLIQDMLQQVESAEELNPLQRQLLKGLFQSVSTVLESTKQLQAEAENDEGESADGAIRNVPGLQFANIRQIDVTRELDPNSVQAQVKRLNTRWDISFPQAMLWGVLGCIAGFSLSIVREQTQGTLLRLRVAPITQSTVLSGKALACFLATMGVIVLLTAIGMALGMRPLSYVKLAAATVMIAFCFVGIMMTLATLGRTEESVSGIGWAINLVMAMVGGCMMPAMFMPGFMQKLSVFSPVFWAIRALEGAIWRDFSWADLWPSFAVLALVGVGGLVIGASVITRRAQWS